MKRSAFNHRKIKRLAIEIKEPIWAARGLAESLWHVTATHAPRGDIGSLTDREIADEIGWKGKPEALLGALVAVGLVDTHADPKIRLVVHDWAEHADRSVGMSLKRQGKDFVQPACARRDDSDAHTDPPCVRTESAHEAHCLAQPEPSQSHARARAQPEPPPDPANDASAPPPAAPVGPPQRRRVSAVPWSWLAGWSPGPDDNPRSVLARLGVQEPSLGDLVRAGAAVDRIREVAVDVQADARVVSPIRVLVDRLQREYAVEKSARPGPLASDIGALQRIERLRAAKAGGGA